MAGPPTAAHASSRIPGVEGLRALAASAIVVLHVASINASAGAFAGTVSLAVLSEPLNEGVTLFFVLSGFLLWRPYAAAVLAGRELPSLRRYARNRLLRILPAYWVVLLLAALVLQSVRLTPLPHSPVDGGLHDPLSLARDALLVQNLAPGTLSNGLVPAWSLAVEVIFYALVPLFALLALLLAGRSSSPRRRIAAALAPAAVLLAIGIASKLAAHLLLPGPEATFAANWHSVLDRSFLTHADLFTAGMLVAVLRAEHERGRLALSDRAHGLLVRATMYSATLLVLGFFLIPRSICDPLVSVAAAALLASIVLRPAPLRRSRLVRVLERRPLAGLGVVSYSVYLWCFPATVFLVRHGLLLEGPEAWRLAFNLAIAVPVIIMLATATFVVVERPALRFRRPRREAPASVRPPVTAAS